MSVPEAELLLKHAVFPPNRPLLVVGCPDRATALELAQMTADSTITIVLDDYARWREMKDLGPRISARFGWNSGETASCASAAVFLPRERDLAEIVLGSTARAVQPDGPVWLVGSIRSGARSLRPRIERAIGPVEASFSGRHCVLFRTARKAIPSAAAEDNPAREFAFPFAGREVKAVSLPGVFSHGRLDPGTRLLLDTLEGAEGRQIPPNANNPGARMLDFGCGAGVIGAALWLAQPDADIALVDSSALAVESAKRTLGSNGLPPGAASPSDVFSDVTGRYDLIVSNPSFHSGTGTDHRVAEALIKEAPARLDHGGRLRIVANRFLKYPPLLKAAFGEFLTIASDGRYAVYEAVRR